MRDMKRLFEIMTMAAVCCWIAVGAAGCGKVEDPESDPSGESQVDPNRDDPTKEYIASGFDFRHNKAEVVVGSYSIKEGNLCVFTVRKKNILGDFTYLKESEISVETSATVDGIVEVYVDTDEYEDGVIVVKGKAVGDTRITLTIKTTDKTLLVRKFLDVTVTEAAKDPSEDDFNESGLGVTDCKSGVAAYGEKTLSVGEERRFCIDVFNNGNFDYTADVFEFRVFFDEGYDSTVISAYTIRDLDTDKAYYAFKGLKAGSTYIVFNAARQTEPDKIVIRRTFRFIVK